MLKVAPSLVLGVACALGASADPTGLVPSAFSTQPSEWQAEAPDPAGQNASAQDPSAQVPSNQDPKAQAPAAKGSSEIDSGQAAPGDTPPMVLGVDLAARAEGATLTFAELDEVLLRRFGLTQMGRGALRQLIDVRVVEFLAGKRQVVISQAQLNSRWKEIESQVVAAGEAVDMAEFLELSGVDRATFRDYLKLSLVQENLTRQALGLPETTKVTVEQQQLWIESEIKAMGYAENAPYWKDGIVATVGDLPIHRVDYAQHLRKQIDNKDIRQACYEALLLKKVRERLPNLVPEAMEAATNLEIERRKAKMEADPRTKGVTFANMLAAQGLNLEGLASDPALISASLANVWVDLTCDEDCLLAMYESEREQFDGMFGAGAEVFAIHLNAGDLKNDLIPRTYAEAEEALNSLRPDLTSLAAFQRIAAVRTDEIAARKENGRIGWVRARTPGVDPAIRRAVQEALAQTPGPVGGQLLGPLRLQGQVVLLCLGERAAPPTWQVMSENVHREQRRRFMVETLPTASLKTYLDKK